MRNETRYSPRQAKPLTVTRTADMRLILSGPLLLVLILVLSGCGLSPNYARPDLDLPQNYALAAGPGNPYAEAGTGTETNAGDRAWWEYFSSPVLLELQQRALANSHAFQAERHVLAQSLSRARAARAGLFPGVSADFGASRRGSATSGGYQTNDAFSGTVQAGYELDIWGKNQDTAKAASERAIAGLYAWRGAGLSLESEVALTYFAYLAARENLKVYDNMLANARDVLSYQEKREKLGAAAPLDVARQRSSVHSMEAGRISYQVRMTEALNSLRLLIGVAETPAALAAAMDAEQLMDLLPPAIAAGLPSDLLLRRPDIAQAEANLKAANADIGVARSAFLPGITLSAGAGWQSDALSSLISPAGALYSLAGSLLQPVFQGGRLTAQYDQATSAQKELVERYRETALGAFLEVAAALDSNTLLREQEKQRGLSANQAAEAYRIARLRYESGAEDFLTVLTAQETMLGAENQVVQSRLERLNTVVALYKALGGGWNEVNEADVYPPNG